MKYLDFFLVVLLGCDLSTETVRPIATDGFWGWAVAVPTIEEENQHTLINEEIPNDLNYIQSVPTGDTFVASLGVPLHSGTVSEVIVTVRGRAGLKFGTSKEIGTSEIRVYLSLGEWGLGNPSELQTLVFPAKQEIANYDLSFTRPGGGAWTWKDFDELRLVFVYITGEVGPIITQTYVKILST